MKIAVVGGGPAGMVAAGVAASYGADVTLIEKNQKLGKKLYITGKGRCNVTNNCTSEQFLKNVTTNPKFLYSSISALSTQAAMDLIEGNGCKLKTERGGRVFPVSDKSSDIIKSLQAFCEKNGVKISLNTKCLGIKKLDEGNYLLLTESGNRVYDKVIVCGGGISYPSTGSTGECYNFVKQLGHNIVNPKPSLCQIMTEEKFVSELAGLTLKNVKVKTYHKDRVIFEEMGEVLFTHNGISGPIPFTISSLINKYDSLKDIKVCIDLKPALNREMLDARLLRDLTLNSNKALKNSLNDLAPKSLIPVIIMLSNIDGETFSNSVTANQRLKLVDVFKGITLKVKALDDIERAVVTSGGVCVKEINPKTMESKLTNGLYFAGEIIDVDALTGGYNVQIAMSTGFIAGTNAALQ